MLIRLRMRMQIDVCTYKVVKYQNLKFLGACGRRCSDLFGKVKFVILKLQFWCVKVTVFVSVCVVRVLFGCENVM